MRVTTTIRNSFKLFTIGLFTIIIVGGAMANLNISFNKPDMVSNNQSDALIIEKVVVKMIAYYGTDLRRTHHALKVHNFARTIGRLEGLSDEDQFILEITAILHDIGIPESERKYNSSAARYQEKEGPPIARELLKDLALDKGVLDRVCFMIGHHHQYDKVDKTDFQILFEADFLVNMYEGKAKRERILDIQKKRFKTKSGNAIIQSMLME